MRWPGVLAALLLAAALPSAVGAATPIALPKAVVDVKYDVTVQAPDPAYPTPCLGVSSTECAGMPQGLFPLACSPACLRISGTPATTGTSTFAITWYNAGRELGPSTKYTIVVEPKGSSAAQTTTRTQKPASTTTTTPKPTSPRTTTTTTEEPATQDLEVEFTGGPKSLHLDPFASKETAVYHVKVTNHGPGAATVVLLLSMDTFRAFPFVVSGDCTAHASILDSHARCSFPMRKGDVKNVDMTIKFAKKYGDTRYAAWRASPAASFRLGADVYAPDDDVPNHFPNRDDFVVYVFPVDK